MEAHEIAEEVAELVEQHEKGDAQRRKMAALWISVLALMLSVSSVGGAKNSKELLTSVVEASDTFSFYQAKTVRQNMYRLFDDEMSVWLAANPKWPDAQKKDVQAKVDQYRATVARYESEPSTGEGRKELLAKAKTLEDSYHHHAHQDPYFEYSEAILQIAIVLASASLTVGVRWLLWLSGAAGLTGFLLLADAFTAAVPLPFL